MPHLGVQAEGWQVQTTMDEPVEHRRRLADLANRLAQAHGLPTRYSLLQQPAGVLAIVAPSGLTAPTRNSTAPWIGFDQTTTAGMVVSFSLPTDYEEGEPVTPVLRWMKDAVASLTGSVMWWSRSRIYAVGVAATGLTSSLTGSGRQSATAVANISLEVAMQEVTSLTGLGAGTVIEVQFGRLIASAGDDYSSSAMLVSVDLIYPQNTRGHDAPFEKYLDDASA